MVPRPQAKPLSLHTIFVLTLSRAFYRPSALSLRGEELEAERNRWAAVSQEWNFSPTGLWGVGQLLTKHLSLVPDKLLESHWDEAKTRVIGESARATLLHSLKGLLFYRCGGVLFFLKDAGKPWNRRPPHANSKSFITSLHTNMVRREENNLKSDLQRS